MSKLLRLDGRRVTLLLALPLDGPPRMLHWGARLPDGIDATADALLAPRAVPHAGLDRDHPDDAAGGGWFGHPTAAGSRDGRDWTGSFAGFAAHNAGEGIRLEGGDAVARLELALELRLDPADDVLRYRSELTNRGDTAYRLDWLSGGTFVLPETASESLS